MGTSWTPQARKVIYQHSLSATALVKACTHMCLFFLCVFFKTCFFFLFIIKMAASSYWQMVPETWDVLNMKRKQTTSVQAPIHSPVLILTVSYWKTFPVLLLLFLKSQSLVMMWFSDPSGKMTPLNWGIPSLLGGVLCCSQHQHMQRRGNLGMHKHSTSFTWLSEASKHM